jgi:predicted ATPase
MTKELQKYIESCDVNLFEGIFKQKIIFKSGLNIISGENGTGKTKLLEWLKTKHKKFFQGKGTPNIVAFNPKRNSEKRNIQQFADKLRRQKIDKDSINQALNQLQFNDSLFSNYMSFGELFIINYENLLDDGKLTKPLAAKEVAKNYNSVLEKIFPNYKIKADWQEKKLSLKIEKNGHTVIPIESLSCGESEVFSLIFNIYTSKDKQDIFLIDEPELHLNWNLENGLFTFFDQFCRTYNKQIIVATHSRSIFNQDFFDKIQFLTWDNQHIILKKEISEEIKEKIAGDAIKTISALDVFEKTFFVEDKAHELVVNSLAIKLSKEIGITVLGDCQKVDSVAKIMAKERVNKAFFLRDGDNQNTEKELLSNNNYIRLKKYCIQNYFFNTEILSKISTPNINSDEVKSRIKKCIQSLTKSNRNISYITLAKESIDFPDEVLDTFDCSNILGTLSKDIGLKDENDLIKKYIDEAHSQSMLNEIFSEITNKI